MNFFTVGQREHVYFTGNKTFYMQFS